MRTVSDIIEAAGGVAAVAERLPQRTGSDGKPIDRQWAVYKWKANGVPSRHWPLLIAMSKATAAELLAANEALRSEVAA